MQIKVLFDKDKLGDRFEAGWGLSYLVDNKILFDAGDKSGPLRRNMHALGVKSSDIKIAVISHDHWDHRGGLWQILEENPEIKVYGCPGFGKGFKNKVKMFGAELVEAGEFLRIEKNIYTTGEIEGEYAFKYIAEQALVAKTSNGLSILTGCAHPGIIRIIENVQQNMPGNIYLVMGGFHLMYADKKSIASIVNKFKQIGVEKSAPAHCSGVNAQSLFKEIYGRDFIEIKAGETIEI